MSDFAVNLRAQGATADFVKSTFWHLNPPKLPNVEIFFSSAQNMARGTSFEPKLRKKLFVKKSDTRPSKFKKSVFEIPFISTGNFDGPFLPKLTMIRRFYLTRLTSPGG